jgi:tRNA pseudouridine38-40 synthase
LQEKVSLQAASRTDAGVHAQGQVVNFFTKKESLDCAKLHKSLNCVLEPSISILAVERAPLTFHPTLDNIGKEYQYFVCNGPMQLPKNRYYSWHFPYPLDRKAMLAAAESLCGTHDYATFCNESALFDRSTVCTVHAIEIHERPSQRLVFTIKGDRFLFRMVRNLVGTILYVGCGKMQAQDISSILQSKKRAQAGVTAPSRGLHLMEIFYTKN